MSNAQLHSVEQFMMDLPPSLLATVGRETPLLFFRDKTYLLDSSFQGGDFLEVDGRKYSIQEGESVTGLEDLYSELHKDTIRAEQERFLEYVMQESQQELARTVQDVGDKIVLNFIVREVLSRFSLRRFNNFDALLTGGETRSREDNSRSKAELRAAEEYVIRLIEALEGDENKKPNKIAVNISSAPSNVLKLLRQIVVDEKKDREDSVEEPLLSRVTDLREFVLLENLVCGLGSVENREGELVLSLSGIRYSLRPVCSIDDLEEKYQMEFSRYFKTKALREGVERFSKVKGLSDIFLLDTIKTELTQKGIYKDNNSGLEIRPWQSGYCIGVPIEEHVLEDSSSHYLYRFDAGTMILPVVLGDPMGLRLPYMLGNYDHPFTQFGSNKNICFGHYVHFPGGMGPAAQAERLIRDGRNVLYAGYQGNLTPYRKLEAFDSRRISPQDCERRGLRVSNRRAG